MYLWLQLVVISHLLGVIDLLTLQGRGCGVGMENAERTEPDAAGADFTCAVCLEEYDEAEAALLPCCAIPASSTTRFCGRCIEIICERSTSGVGRCPNCRAFLRVGEGGNLEVTDQTDTCSCCNQVRVIVQMQGHVLLCDACLFGTEMPLLYECEGCGRYQRIPHPMYRYQPTPGEFGNNTWACHVRCAAQTRWRLKPSELDSVPVEDCPDSWGLREQWLASVREQRRQVRCGRLGRRALAR